MKSDGSDVQVIAVPAATPQRPAWSPDGTKLAYRRGVPRCASRDLAVANADGSGETVIAIRGDADEPRVVAGRHEDRLRRRFRPGTNYSEIFVVDATGGTPTQLTFDSNSTDPTWSPDGTRIAFVRASEARRTAWATPEVRHLDR